jgi:hypothetical protein
MIRYNKMAGFYSDEIAEENPADFGREVTR